MTPVFGTLEDSIERSSVLIGSPQQLVDKVLPLPRTVRPQVIHLQADHGGLTDKQHRESLELFQAEVAPVLRREIPSRPFHPPLTAAATA